jgi:hypothetical protein
VSPEERVPTEQSAWGRLDVDAIMSHLSADAVWHNVAIRAFRGYDEIREAFQGYLNRMTDAEMDILNLAGAGNVVHTERVGHLEFNFAIWPPLHRTLSWVRATQRMGRRSETSGTITTRLPMGRRRRKPVAYRSLFASPKG